jgi:hypothetical protein
VVLALAAAAQPVPQAPLTIGSAKTAVADPTIPLPATAPCRVTLFTDVRFADFSSKRKLCSGSTRNAGGDRSCHPAVRKPRRRSS